MLQCQTKLSLSLRSKNKSFAFILYSFTSDAELDQKTLEFIYGKYNHKRPHTHNGGRTPHAARYAAQRKLSQSVTILLDNNNTFKAMVEKMFNGAATAKGALMITPSKVIVTTPGAENKKEIQYI